MKIKVVCNHELFEFEGDLRISDNCTLDILKADKKGEYKRIASFKYWDYWLEVT